MACFACEKNDLNQYKGCIKIWSVFDCILNIGYAICGIILINKFGQYFYMFVIGVLNMWSFIIIATDIMLFSYPLVNSNIWLIKFWLIIMMVQFILQFLNALIILISVCHELRTHNWGDSQFLFSVPIGKYCTCSKFHH